jgi:hypothetical protein
MSVDNLSTIEHYGTLTSRVKSGTRSDTGYFSIMSIIADGLVGRRTGEGKREGFVSLDDVVSFVPEDKN